MAMAFMAPLPAPKAQELTLEPPKAEARPLPIFKRRWWHSKNKLDARPMIWSLYNHPEEWEWRTPWVRLRLEGGGKKPPKDIFAFDSLVAWLETKDPKEEYYYIDGTNCLIAQYFKSKGKA